jgi:hypothetical protein
MLNHKLPELQEIMANSEDVLTGRLLGVEDKLGATLEELGSGDSITGGAYVNVWIGTGSALENNQAVATIVGKLAQQVKLNATAIEKVNHANMESAHLKTQFVGLYQHQKAEEMKVTQLGGQLYQLTMPLKQMKQEHQQKYMSALFFYLDQGNLPRNQSWLMVSQWRTQLSNYKCNFRWCNLASYAAYVAGHVFEYYEDIYQWVVANCSP